LREVRRIAHDTSYDVDSRPGEFPPQGSLYEREGEITIKGTI
jgi:hypothetical protein